MRGENSDKILEATSNDRSQSQVKFIHIILIIRLRYLKKNVNTGSIHCTMNVIESCNVQI